MIREGYFVEVTISDHGWIRTVQEKLHDFLKVVWWSSSHFSH